MDLQALVDGMSRQWQKKRAASQMTLGSLIARLESIPPDAPVVNLKGPHSYRGYYDDLAFHQEEGTRPASELLADCKAAMGQVFQGYKGGDFVMGALTPVWVADYGQCGEKLIEIRVGGKFTTKQDDD